MEQIEPGIQYAIASLLVGAGGLVLTWLRSSGKWVGKKLFGDEDKNIEGWIPKLINTHCEMMDAMKTVPESIRTLSHADEQQTILLQKIVDTQQGHDAKLDAIIDAKACINQACLEYFAKNEPQAMESLRKAAGYLLKVKEST